MTRKALDHGLRGLATRCRLKEQHIADNAAGEHSHHLAVEALRDWQRRRIDEALGKVSDKPIAETHLKRLRERATRGLSQRESAMLLAIESRLAKGEDIEDRPIRPRHFLPSKRPDWMYNQALLPKKPPSPRT